MKFAVYAVVRQNQKTSQGLVTFKFQNSKAKCQQSKAGTNFGAYDDESHG